MSRAARRHIVAAVLPFARIRFQSVVTSLLRAIALLLIVVAGWQVAMSRHARTDEATAADLALPIGATPPTTRVYDVRDLVERWMESPYFSPPPSPSPSPKGGAFVSRPFYREPRDLMAMLTHAIENTVGINRDGWAGSGGTDTVSFAGTELIVIAPAPVQRRIAKFLRELRRSEAIASVPRTNGANEPAAGTK